MPTVSPSRPTLPCARESRTCATMRFSKARRRGIGRKSHFTVWNNVASDPCSVPTGSPRLSEIPAIRAAVCFSTRVEFQVPALWLARRGQPAGRRLPGRYRDPARSRKMSGNRRAAYSAAAPAAAPLPELRGHVVQAHPQILQSTPRLGDRQLSNRLGFATQWGMVRVRVCRFTAVVAEGRPWNQPGPSHRCPIAVNR